MHSERASKTGSEQRYWREYWEGRTGGQHRHNEEWYFEKKAQEIAGLVPPGGKLLDYGCGSADLLLYYAPLFDSVLAADFSQSQLVAARERATRFGTANVIFLHADEQTLAASLGDQQFDCIILSAVVQHLLPEQLAILLATFRKHISKNGAVVLVDVIDPVLAWLWRLGMLDSARVGPLTLAYRALRMLAYRTRRSLRGLPPDEIGYAHSRNLMSDLAQRAGFAAELLGARHYAYRYHAMLRPA